MKPMPTWMLNSRALVTAGARPDVVDRPRWRAAQIGASAAGARLVQIGNPKRVRTPITHIAWGPRQLTSWLGG